VTPHRRRDISFAGATTSYEAARDGCRGGDRQARARDAHGRRRGTRSSRPANSGCAEAAAPSARSQGHTPTPSLRGGIHDFVHQGNEGWLFAAPSLTARIDTTAVSRVSRRRQTSRCVALTEMYPRCTRVLHEQTTRYAYLQAFRRSPLTDSNRRPPPYHGSSEPVTACTRGHSRARLSWKSIVRNVLAVPARDRSHSLSCTRLVPAPRLLFSKQTTASPRSVRGPECQSVVE
jgi:hypothetical protein